MSDQQDEPDKKDKPAKRKVGRPAVYKFGKLEVEDSFLVDAEDRHLARAAATTFKKRHPGWNYKSVKVSEPKGAVRFTRIA